MNEPESELNSLAWWNNWFSVGWDNFDGKNQTKHFMTKLVDNLPPRETTFLKSRNLSILDWGCAMGDGVDVLARTFPNCKVAGLDFSKISIGRARESYSAYEFLLDEVIPREFDVIVTSNCLEHFVAPLELAQRHLASCRQLYITLVPYMEGPVFCHSHVHSFNDNTFPARLGEFTRIYCKNIEVSAQFWCGNQLLTIYGSPEYVAGINNG